MSFINEYITLKNNSDEKILSVFLTSGFPDKESFIELALKILNAGADMLEIGFPFSDPLADGPIIQHSSQVSLENGVNLKTTFNFIKEIRKRTDKPLIMMGYANPVLSYDIKKFSDDAKDSGVNGVIIPDIPIEEYDNFFDGSFEGLDKILLITPTTSVERIGLIDDKSSGFVYCVSVSGTTGIQNNSKSESVDFVKKTRTVVKRNKTLVGFGISNEEDAKLFAANCDGIIVGSAIIKSLMNNGKDFQQTLKLVSDIKKSLI